MEGKKSFIVYTSWKIWLDGLTTEQKGQWLNWVMQYTNDEWDNKEIEYPTDPVVKMACLMAQDQLKRDLTEWKEQKQKRSDSGRLGGIQRAVNQNQALSSKSKQCLKEVSKSKQSQANQAVNVNVNDNVNVNVNNNNVIKNNNMCVSSAENQLTNDTKQDEIDVMFEAFWKEYPRKIDKKGCLTKFKHIKKLKENYSKIMGALKIQKQSRQWQDIQYIPHPKTWLNQERWNNEELSNPNPKDKWDGYKFNEI